METGAVVAGLPPLSFARVVGPWVKRLGASLWRLAHQPLSFSGPLAGILGSGLVAWLGFVCAPAVEAFGNFVEFYPPMTRLYLATYACWGVVPAFMAGYWLVAPMFKGYRSLVLDFGNALTVLMALVLIRGGVGYMPMLGLVDHALPTTVRPAPSAGPAESCDR